MGKPASNFTEARVERYVRLAQQLGLSVYGFELLEGRGIRVLTAPLQAMPADNTNEDPVERWFKDRGDDL